jgi:hypothetical protein
MTGTNCDLFTHNQSRSYLNHLVALRTDHEAVVNTNMSVQRKINEFQSPGSPPRIVCTIYTELPRSATKIYVNCDSVRITEHFSYLNDIVFVIVSIYGDEKKKTHCRSTFRAQREINKV